MCHGAANIEVEIRYRDVTFKKLSASVSDKRDGTYVINFFPDVSGVMYISIYVNGKPIKVFFPIGSNQLKLESILFFQNSPFTAKSRNLRPHLGIYHCCAFCSSKGSKHASCACVGTFGDRNYCAHGWAGWPGKGNP
jgi:tripartite motif-containing protein 45